MLSAGVLLGSSFASNLSDTSNQVEKVIEGVPVYDVFGHALRGLS